jgi:hypothetical protein
MTKVELIDALKEYPDHATIVTVDRDGWHNDIETVQTFKCLQDEKTGYYEVVLYAQNGRDEVTE